MEECVGQDMVENAGCADKVFVELPQGTYFEGGRLLAVEDVPDDSEEKIEGGEAPLLMTNEPALQLCGNGNEGVIWVEVREINLHDKIVGDVLPAKESLVEGMMVDGPLVGDSVGLDEGSVMVVNEIGLVMNDSDIVLDLCEAQPLQNMDFLNAGESSCSEIKNHAEGLENGKESQPKFPLGGKFLDEDFPSLKDGASKRGKNKVAYKPTLQQENSRKAGTEAANGHTLPPQSGSASGRQQRVPAT